MGKLTGKVKEIAELLLDDVVDCNSVYDKVINEISAKEAAKYKFIYPIYHCETGEIDFAVEDAIDTLLDQIEEGEIEL